MRSTLGLLVIAEDPLARAGLAAMLGSLPGVTIVAQEDSQGLISEEALPSDEAIDAAIWDAGWSGVADSLDLTALGLPVIALVYDEEQAADAWQIGAKGLLWRNTAEADILAAAVAVSAGFVVMSPGLSPTVNHQARRGVDEAFDDLTPRETQVLQLVAQGLTNKAIGQRLTISEHTVKFHINAILSKLGAQSRTEAVVIATRQGQISL